MTADRKPKRPRDLNQRAKLILDIVTGKATESDGDKDPAAVARGRKGGKIGGKTRARRLSPKERSEAAAKAARARWDR